ncbi:HNH endonuclease family protein [Thalassotalea aquiviva]|uniref:HNH endonuclease family protein n=1 Tax=Thalassotalea aquiviva TaxID=3242415 RepID=UPI00352B6250
MRLKPSVCLLSLCVSLPSYATQIVKKSNSGICHTVESPYYQQTKNFIAFPKLSDCLDSGGRLAKNTQSFNNIQPALKTTHEASSWQSNKALNYSRDQFGKGWEDSDSDCQNTRMELLIGYSLSSVHYKTAKSCQVTYGKWVSPFTDKTIYHASDIDIDHIVPLHWAWEHGAREWPLNKRIEFANDPANLLSVEASLNRQKGAKDISEWLPPKNQCQYIDSFNKVVKAYKLGSSQTEQKLSHVKRQYCS